MPLYLGTLALIDGALIFLSFSLGLYLRFAGDLPAAETYVGSLAPRAIVYTLVLMLAMLAVGLYRGRQRIGGSETLVRLAAAVSLAGLANATLFYLFPSMFVGRGFLAISLLSAFVLILFSRVAFFSAIDHDRFRRNVLVLGNGQVAASLRELCSIVGQRSFRIVGFLPAPGDEPGYGSLPVFTNNPSLLKLVKERNVDEIVVALDNRRESFPSRQLLDCRMDGVRVTESLTFLEKETGKINLDSLRPSWLIYGGGFRQSSAHRVFKRFFDVAASLAVLLFTFPIIALAVLAVLIESGGRGGVLYRQRRIGFHGKPFELFKLRSMIPDAEIDGQARWSSRNDPRVTRVGTLLRRLRIDELPQILNILKGEMSFVGPRPERPEFVEQLAEQLPFYRERHCVKPGLTGWAQLSYPYGSSVEDAKQKLQYDLYYVKNYSPTFDLLILIQTLEAVLWHREHPTESDAGSEGDSADAHRHAA